MKIKYPMLQINYDKEFAKTTLKKVLQEKHWKDFQIATLKLSLYPTHFFTYDAYTETKDNNENKIVTEEKKGELALDLKHKKFFKNEIKKDQLNKYQEEPDLDNYEIQEDTIPRNLLPQMILFKTSKEIKVPKENIIISNQYTRYVPIWELQIELKEKNYEVKINAVTGKARKEEQIPIREKGYMEITKETLSELTVPKNWIKYTKEILHKSTKKTVEKTKKITKETIQKQEIKKIKQVKNYWLEMVIIVLIILVIILMSLQ